MSPAEGIAICLVIVFLLIIGLIVAKIIEWHSRVKANYGVAKQGKAFERISYYGLNVNDRVYQPQYQTSSPPASPTDRYCPQCGSPVEQSDRYCPKCGKKRY